MKIYVWNKNSVLKIMIGVAVVFTLLFLPKPSMNKLIQTVARAKKELPIYCVETDKKQVSISFDAAWGADDTDELLSILEKNNVKTTFFLVGSWIRRYPEQVKKIYEAGHDIGNHSNKHPEMTKLDREHIKSELLDAHKEIKELLDIDMDLFRPPYGAYNDIVIEVAKECGYYTIQWDIDSLDWKEYGVQQMVNRVLKSGNLSNGSIILFHNNAKYTKDALDTIIKGLKSKGFDIVPISQLIIRENYYLDHMGRQREEETRNDNEKPMD